MLDISSNQKNEKSAYVINLSGSMDSDTAQDFEVFFSDMLAKGYRYFILESSRLTGMSGAGIAAMVQFLKKVENAGGAVCFVALNKENSMLLEFFGVVQKFPSFPHIRDAESYITEIASFSEGGASAPIGRTPSYRDIYGAGGFTRREPLADHPYREMSPPAHPNDYSLRNRFRSETNILENDSFLEKSLSGMAIAPEDSILECEQCGSVMRVYRSGKHMCPSCSIEFFVKQDGAVSYFEKLKA